MSDEFEVFDGEDLDELFAMENFPEETEAYQELCKKIEPVLDKVKSQNASFIRLKHEIGLLVVEHCKSQKFDTDARDELFEKLENTYQGCGVSMSAQEVDRCYRFARQYPQSDVLEELIEDLRQQNKLSWHQIVNNVLPESSRNRDDNDLWEYYRNVHIHVSRLRELVFDRGLQKSIPVEQIARIDEELKKDLESLCPEEGEVL